MAHHDHTKILAFVGLPGSGVSTATEYLRSKHYASVYFGGVVLAAMKQAEVDDTPENEQVFREQLRQKEGPEVVVQKIIPEINSLIQAGQRHIVADGLYTWTEYKALKHEFPGQLIVVAIVASRHLRHRRLVQRSERPLTETQAAQRDWAEVENLEKGGPIAIADHYITNDTSLEQFQVKLDQLLRQLEF